MMDFNPGKATGGKFCLKSYMFFTFYIFLIGQLLFAATKFNKQTST